MRSPHTESRPAPDIHGDPLSTHNQQCTFIRPIALMKTPIKVPTCLVCLFAFLFVLGSCVCTHIHTFTHVCMHTPMQERESEIFPAHTLSHFFHISSLNLELTSAAKLPDQQALGILESTTPENGVTGMYRCTQLSTWVLGIRTQVIVLAQ